MCADVAELDEKDRANALCERVKALLAWPLDAAPRRVFDGEATTADFAVVVFARPDAALEREEGTIPADNVAAVIDFVDELSGPSLREAYARVEAAKRLHKRPPPVVGDVPVSTSTLGIIYARRAGLTIEALAAELERLNDGTPSQYWPDMVVLEGVGLFQYSVQFPGTGVRGSFLPPAPGATRDKPPPMYILLTFGPAGAATFQRLAHTLCGHLAFFSPGAKLPDLEKLIEGTTNTAIVQAGYQYNLAGDLVPVPPEFQNDRYIPHPPPCIESSKGELLATIERVPWQDGGVILLRGKLPLEGLLVFLGEASRTTLMTVKPVDELQLSYVLPLSHQQFIAFLEELQRRSNMVVKPNKRKWIAQTFANEGTTSPFMARLFLGVMRVRDAAYPEPNTRKSFDDIYEMTSHSLMGARDAANAIKKLWEEHADKLAKGDAVHRKGGATHIGEGIDRELRRSTEDFLNTSVRALKHGLQKLADELGTDVGFWFKKQQAFSQGLALLRSTDVSLADYIDAARSEWSETLIDRRNSIEHEGWSLPKIAYEDRGDSVVPTEPVVDGRPIREFVDFMLDRLCCAVEDIAMHLLSARLSADGVCLHEIPIDDRRRECVERFRITAAIGGEEPWTLKYSVARFEGV